MQARPMRQDTREDLAPQAVSGLCGGCVLRSVCDRAARAGGVWRCEDYVSGPDGELTDARRET